MNRYESNANYRRSIKAQNKRNYNAAIAQGMAAIKNLGGNTSKIHLANLPNNESVPMTEEEMEQALAELEAEMANGAVSVNAANKTKNGRKFTNLSPEEIGALNAENTAAFDAWLLKSIEEM